MSTIESSLQGGIASAPEKKAESDFPSFEQVKNDFLALVKKREFHIGMLLAVLFLLAFWTVTRRLPGIWFEAEGYYQHGVIVPLAAAFLVYLKWDKIKNIPRKGSYLALIPFAGLVYLSTITTRSEMSTATPMLMLVAIPFLFAAILGWKWAFVLLPITGFLALALPLWDGLIDRHTMDLQIISTSFSYSIFKMLGMGPIRENPTLIHLNNYSMAIEAACSGMKLTLTMVSIVAFVVLLNKLKWWGNLTLVAAAIPLSIIINILRITAIGLAGEYISADAAMWVHDYGSYGFVLLSFFIVYKMAQWLGLKV